MTKVFYIISSSQDVFYVKAEDEEQATEILREEVGKHIFERTLAGDNSLATPATLGKNVIVGYVVRESVLTSELDIEDITAQAYVFAKQGDEYWRDWMITEEDVLCQE